MKVKYTYPAIFEPAEEGGYLVDFPDIPSCYTEGDTMEEALSMAKDCLEMMLVHYEDENIPVPSPSDSRSIKTEHVVSYVLADTGEWRRLVDNRAVKKTLSIPAWLNAKAEKAAINFSQTLQEALAGKLHVSLA